MLMTDETVTRAGVRASATGRDLVLVSWTPANGAGAAAGAAFGAYEAIAGVLAERGCVPVQERVFGDLAAAPAAAGGRARALAAAGVSWPVPPTFVEGSPVGRDGLAGIHVIGARGTARVLSEGDRVFGTLVECDGARLLGLADVGRRASARLAPGPAEDAGAAIDAASELLAREGFSFRDVARTWFYLRDILDWYGPFNAVRNQAFRRMGLMGPNGDGKIPASTGIEGRNARGGRCALDLLAAQPANGAPLRMKRLSNRKQNEATEYGSAFARAMELVLGDARYVFVSGTASIDDHGATVHKGDFETQARFTLEAVSALLEGAGARLSDVQQATAFLKNPCDARSFARIVEAGGLAQAPLVTTVADVCRDDLLFEIDATAVVPLDGSRR
jgi:enamine deaminase RidA (YjgF/YER057c/UK114 family)